MEKSLVLTSIDLPTTKTGVKTGYQLTDGHISQIPGLSPTTSHLSEERTKGRMFKVHESDSAYVKLAKQGGHRDLLWHQGAVPTTTEPTPYKPPDFFGIKLEDTSKPSEDKKNPGAFQPKEPPFGTDNMSAWERDESLNNGNVKDNNANDSQMENLPTSNDFYKTNKFKKIMFDKRPVSVDMSKLLSFGYAKSDKPPQ